MNTVTVTALPLARGARAGHLHPSVELGLGECGRGGLDRTAWIVESTRSALLTRPSFSTASRRLMLVPLYHGHHAYPHLPIEGCGRVAVWPCHSPIHHDSYDDHDTNEGWNLPDHQPVQLVRIMRAPPPRVFFPFAHRASTISKAIHIAAEPIAAIGKEIRGKLFC